MSHSLQTPRPRQFHPFLFLSIFQSWRIIAAPLTSTYLMSPLCSRSRPAGRRAVDGKSIKRRTNTTGHTAELNDAFMAFCRGPDGNKRGILPSRRLYILTLGLAGSHKGQFLPSRREARRHNARIFLVRENSRESLKLSGATRRLSMATPLCTPRYFPFPVQRNTSAVGVNGSHFFPAASWLMGCGGG